MGRVSCCYYQPVGAASFEFDEVGHRLNLNTQ